MQLFKFTYKLYLVLFVLAFILYGNSINNEYNLDDDTAVNNPLIAKGISAIPEIFSTHFYDDGKYKFEYRPTVKASFAIENSLWGSNPHLSHFVNVILYWIACCLLLTMLVLLFNEAAIIFPFLIAVLFLVHPLHTEVVCSLKNRDVLFSFIGSISAMILYHQYAVTNKWKFLLLGAVALVFAAFSKSDSRVYIFIIPFALYYFKKAKGSQIMMILLSYALPIIVMHVINVYILAPGISKGMIFHENPLIFEDGFISRIAMAFYSAGNYIRLHVFPYPLISYYGFSYITIPGIIDWRVISSALLSIALLIYCIVQFKKRNTLVFGIIYFIVAISMFLNFVEPVVGIFGERFTFHASVGFCIALTALLIQVFKPVIPNTLELAKFSTLTNSKPFYICFGFILLIYSGMTIARNPDWKDIYTLTKKDVEHAPNSVQLLNLYAYSNQQRYFDPKTVEGEKEGYLNDAITSYKTSLNILPDQAVPSNNLGILLSAGKKNYSEAIPHFIKATQTDTAMAEYHFNLGYTQEALNNRPEAIKSYYKAISIDRRYLKPYFALTQTLFALGSIDEAFQLSLAGIKENPQSAELFKNAGYLLLCKKDTVNALKFYEESLRLDPNNTGVQQKISVLKGNVAK